MPSVAPGVEAWDAWRPEEVALRLADVAVPWHVVGGWALDLWHGRQTRPHGDLEIAVARADFSAVRERLAGFDLYVADDGSVVPLADSPPPAPTERRQVWVCDATVPAWRLDVFAEPRDRDTWVFRRDPRIVEPYARMVATTDGGIPYLCPEGALVYKARDPRGKDDADFVAALPRLAPGARRWLARALDLAYPGHRWRACL
jgi:hypothetical protein